MSDIVLAVDPGREQCGLAVVHDDGVLARAVVMLDELDAAVRTLRGRWGITEVVVGNHTGREEALGIIRRELPNLPVTLGDETGTTLEARRLYFAEHPRRGWRRLVPIGLQVPPEPYDDYAAVVVARRRLARGLPSNLERASRKEEESS